MIGITRRVGKDGQGVISRRFIYDEAVYYGLVSVGKGRSWGCP